MDKPHTGDACRCWECVKWLTDEVARLEGERDEAKEAAETIMVDWADEEDWPRLRGIYPWLNEDEPQGGEG